VRSAPSVALVGAALGLAAVIAQAAPDAEQLLRASEQAERNHSYRGMRLTRMRFQEQTVNALANVLHRKPATTRTEYVLPPTMHGTVILQIGRERWRASSRDRRWQRVQQAAEGGNLDLLLRNYALRTTGSELVANRPCVLLLITPKHEGNPSKRMWVDRATGLVLRSELLNWKQQIVGGSTFRDLEIDPDLSAQSRLLDPPPVAQAPPARSGLTFTPAHPRYVPPGYVFASTETVPLGKHLAAHLRYTDGLNTISLFQAPARAFADQQPFAAAEYGFTQVITWRRGDVAYALMGDIDPLELRKMGNSLGPAAPVRSR